MNGTRSLSRVYAVPAQRRENWRAAERHNTPSFSFFFACMTLPVDLNSTSLTRIFAQAPEDGCQAPREFLRSGEAARSHPAWTSSAKLSAVVGPLTSPIRCHGKLRSYNVGIQ